MRAPLRILCLEDDPRDAEPDFGFKTRLARIVYSVHRALRETHEIVERRRAEEALRRNEAYLAEAQRLSHTCNFGWTSPADIFTCRVKPFGSWLTSATTVTSYSANGVNHLH